MNFFRAVCLKRTSAIFLLLLFVFTHALKAFHSHEFYYTPVKNPANKNTAALKADFSCTICDFQIAKDCDSEKFPVHISARVHVIISVDYCNSGLTNSFQGIHSVRGPPSLII